MAAQIPPSSPPPSLTPRPSPHSRIVFLQFAEPVVVIPSSERRSSPPILVDDALRINNGHAGSGRNVLRLFRRLLYRLKRKKMRWMRRDGSKRNHSKQLIRFVVETPKFFRKKIKNSQTDARV